MTTLIIKFWKYLSKRRRIQIGILLFFSIFSSFMEILGIGMILPFLGVLTAPDKVFTLPYIQPAIQRFNIVAPDQLVFPLTIAFIATSVFAGFTRLTFLWISNRLSNAITGDLSIGVYRHTLYQPYEVHIARNSSEILAATGKASALVYTIIQPIFTIFNSVLMIVSIFSFLISLYPIASITIFLGFGTIYTLIALFSKKYFEVISIEGARESIQIQKALQEGLGGIRDILLDGSQDVYCNVYKTADRKIRNNAALASFISATPRYVMEVLGMMLIAGFSYFLSRGEGGLIAHLPMLVAIALGAQRLLPALHLGYSAWASLKIGEAQLRDVLALLYQPIPSYVDLPKPEPLRFTKKISLTKLWFRYQNDGAWVLQNINLEIFKGMRIGFVGITGSGKSTLLDLIMALLNPTKGNISVDGQLISNDTMRPWQLSLAHVPQSIYLSDNSITENIAFGIPLHQINFEKVKHAAEQAQIAQHIETLKDGYDTLVGERGVRLSGGQRQRIGIARALYKDAKVIIFDEATSALDNETEKAVMEAIEGLGKELTILIIAHRLSTVKNCDKIVELSSGKITRMGTYKELFKERI